MRREVAGPKAAPSCSARGEHSEEPVRADDRERFRSRRLGQPALQLLPELFALRQCRQGVLDTVLELQEVQVGHAIGKPARRVAYALELLPLDRREQLPSRRLYLVDAVHLDLGSNDHQPHRATSFFTVRRALLVTSTGLGFTPYEPRRWRDVTDGRRSASTDSCLDVETSTRIFCRVSDYRPHRSRSRRRSRRPTSTTRVWPSRYRSNCSQHLSQGASNSRS